MDKKFILKELSKIFHDIESAKNKIWKAIPKLKRSMTICQGTEKMLTLARSTILIYTRRWQSTVQATLDKFFTKK